MCPDNFQAGGGALAPLPPLQPFRTPMLAVILYTTLTANICFSIENSRLCLQHEAENFLICS